MIHDWILGADLVNIEALELKHSVRDLQTGDHVPANDNVYRWLTAADVDVMGRWRGVQETSAGLRDQEGERKRHVEERIWWTRRGDCV